MKRINILGNKNTKKKKKTARIVGTKYFNSTKNINTKKKYLLRGNIRRYLESEQPKYANY